MTLTKNKLFVKNLIFVIISASLIFLVYGIVFGFPYWGYGDYYEQQIAFYTHANEFIKGGNWLYDWNSELGSEFIPTYAFYLVFSPFFLITLLFPTSWMVYEMPILIVIKVLVSDLTAILYFKDKFKKKESVYLAAFLYAFCGWFFDAMFFNHFIEVMAFFPLYLWSFDKTIKGEGKFHFALLTTVTFLMNYFFWVGEAIFIFMYFVIRKIFDKSYKVTILGIVRFVIEGLIGIGITGVVLLPIANVTFLNPRAQEKLELKNAFIYSNFQMYFSILESCFQFPPSLIWRGSWFAPLQYGCPSQVLYIPVINMFLIIPFFKRSNEKWLKVFLGTLTVFAFVPVLNSVFSLFSKEYYARWYYMFVFFLIFASVKMLDEHEALELKKDVFKSIAICAAIYVVLAIIGIFVNVTKNEFVSYYNIGLSVVSFGICIVSFIFVINMNSYKKMVQMICICTVAFSVCYFISNIYYEKQYRTSSNSNMSFYDELEKIMELRTDDMNDDEDFYRVYYGSYLNTGLMYNKSSMIGYNSITPKSIYDFYKLMGEERTVQSNFAKKDSPLLPIFSTKYVLKKENDEFSWEESEYLPMGINFNEYVMVKDWEDVVASETDISSKLYLDQNHYFAYIGIIDRELEESDNPDDNKKEYDITIEDKKIHVSETDNQIIYEIIDDFQQIEIPLPENIKNRILIDGTNYQLLDAKIYKEKLRMRKEYGTEITFFKYINFKSVFSANLENLKMTQYGMTANSNLDKEQLVFFTIPYDKLWDAYIDGEEVEIIKGDNAFIVLDIPEGYHSIELKFNTTYYEDGLKITYVFTGIFVCYALVDIILTKKKKATKMKESVDIP